VHHFGAALNGLTHFHCLITDGLFAATPAGEAIFYADRPLTDADVARVQAQVRHRVLAWLVRHGDMDPEAMAAMRAWRRCSRRPGSIARAIMACWLRTRTCARR